MDQTLRRLVEETLLEIVGYHGIKSMEPNITAPGYQSCSPNLHGFWQDDSSSGIRVPRGGHRNYGVLIYLLNVSN